MNDIFENVMQRLLRLNEEDVIVPMHHIRSLVKPGLKVVRNDDKLKFTVASVTESEVTLTDAAMGTTLRIGMDDFAQKYSVD